MKKKLLIIAMALILPSIALLGCTTATSATNATSSESETSAATTLAEETSSSNSAAAETTDESLPVIHDEAEAFNYSEGIDEKGFWTDVKALDHVSLAKYKGVPVPAEHHTVSDQAVEDEVDYILSLQSSTKQVTDRAIADGDQVNIDFVGSIDGVPFEGGSTNGAGTDVTIGVTQYIDDFLEQLIGHKPGENFDIQVTFPEDYGQTELNGKEATFSITVNHIVEVVKPELTDAFVENYFANTTGWKTVADLRESLYKNLQATAMTTFLQEYIVENSEVKDISQPMITYQEQSMLSYFRGQATAYGTTFEELLQMAENVASEAELVTKYEEKNTTSAKFNLIIQAIAEQENLSVNEEDLKNYFTEKMGMTDYSAYESQFGKPYIMQVVLINKVMELLIAEADLQ